MSVLRASVLDRDLIALGYVAGSSSALGVCDLYKDF